MQSTVQKHYSPSTAYTICIVYAVLYFPETIALQHTDMHLICIKISRSTHFFIEIGELRRRNVDPSGGSASVLTILKVRVSKAQCPFTHSSTGLENMQSLFPTHPSTGGAIGGGRGSRTLIEIKAGKCEMTEIQDRPGIFRVVPDKRKGSLSLFSQDGLVRFRWTDRGTDSVVDEFIVMPEDINLKKVNTGRENDRVYLLKWNNHTRKFMFWMQDKNGDKDEENCNKFNEFARNPNQPPPNRLFSNPDPFVNVLLPRHLYSLLSLLYHLKYVFMLIDRLID